MPFTKGNTFGAGRPKGSGNKETKAIREAFQILIENNLDNMQSWIAAIANHDPARAFNLMVQITEYVLPKLARAELVGDEGKDLFNNLTFKFNLPEKKENEDGKEQESTQEESE